MSAVICRARFSRAFVPLLVAALLALPLVAATAEPASAATQTTFLWTNRGAGDGFDVIFGANAEEARAVVDAALDAWEKVFPTLNRPSTPGDSTISITVNANPGATPTSCGGSASGVFDANGYPVGGAVNVNGNAVNWFIDPTPHEHSEFTANIDNAFSGDAQAGSPALGLCDLYTLVALEATHILGITSNGASRFQTSGGNNQLTMTGTTCSGPGDLWQFTGPSITHLMTSNNGGNNGSDFGVPVHSAEPCASFGGLSGANDVGNAVFEGSRRYLVGNSMALILKDVFNYGLVMPETFGTFYSVLNSTTGNVLVRGGDDNNGSNDVISIARAGSEIVVSVDVGNDVAGTGPTNEFVTRYDEGAVQSINVNALDGNDNVTVAAGIGVPVTVNGGTGNDIISGSPSVDAGDGNDFVTGTAGSDNITAGTGNDTVYALDGHDNVAAGTGNDRIFAGTGSNSVSDGNGNDLVDLTENAAAVTYVTGGGNDTVLGTSFADVLEGSVDADRLEGRAGNDLLRGGPGLDEMLGGDGSDTLLWDVADDSDLLEGGAGDADAVIVNGAPLSGDIFAVAAAPGSRVRFERTNVVPFVLDVASVETLRINGGGGAEVVSVADLTNTDLRKVQVDVGPPGDLDTVSVDGRSTSDNLEVSTAGGGIDVGGLLYDVRVLNASQADGDILTVNGMAGSDTVTVNGGSAAETPQYAPNGVDQADVSGLFGATVRARTMEGLVVDGQGGGDSLTVMTPAGANDVNLLSGAAVDAGDVHVDNLLPMQFRHLGGGGDLALETSGGGRADRLLYHGTAGEDAFSIAGAGPIGLNARRPAFPSGVQHLVLLGLEGDDTFAAAATLPFDTTTVRGGALFTDRLVLTGAAGAATVDYGASTVTGYGGTVAHQGIEALDTQQAGVAGSTLSVMGTGANDAFEYRPSAADAGAVANSQGPALNFSGVGGDFSIDPGAGSDRVTVFGTGGEDTFTSAAGAIIDIALNATKNVLLPLSSTELAQMASDEGADTFDITTFGDVSPVLSVLGDGPSPKRFGDTLFVRDGTGKAQFRDVKSHFPEEGSVFANYRATDQSTRIDYFSTETIKFFRK